MKLKMFSVFDSKAKAYLPPFLLPETVMAVRAFGDCVMDSGHAFGKHPEDYTLFQVGSFDQNSGMVERLDVLPVIARGHELKDVIVASVTKE